MTTLTANSLSVGYQNKLIIQELSLSFPKGKITSLIGPNGSGKSTLLKALARVLQPKQGDVLLENKSIFQMSTKEVAKKIALLAQSSESDTGLTVQEVVSFGRYPYQKGFSSFSQKDVEKIQWALAVTNLLKLADRSMQTLSGGQRQRVWIAMALAQDTEILILDEPTTFLDPAHQLEILLLLQEINQEHGKTIIMSIHDLNLASRFSDQVLALKSGTLLHKGTPQQVITEDNLSEVFEIQAEIILNQKTNKPIVLAYDLLKGRDQDE
ncbi:ABC transporter ATP-binding protein [Enterococcus sp. LJL120]